MWVLCSAQYHNLESSKHDSGDASPSSQQNLNHRSPTSNKKRCVTKKARKGEDIWKWSKRLTEVPNCAAPLFINPGASFPFCAFALPRKCQLIEGLKERIWSSSDCIQQQRAHYQENLSDSGEISVKFPLLPRNCCTCLPLVD